MKRIQVTHGVSCEVRTAVTTSGPQNPEQVDERIVSLLNDTTLDISRIVLIQGDEAPGSCGRNVDTYCTVYDPIDVREDKRKEGRRGKRT